MTIGISYKAVDLVHDVGDAAIDKKNAWLDTQLVLTGIDARTLKAMADNGYALR